MTHIEEREAQYQLIARILLLCFAVCFNSSVFNFTNDTQSVMYKLAEYAYGVSMVCLSRLIIDGLLNYDKFNRENLDKMVSLLRNKKKTM